MLAFVFEILVFASLAGILALAMRTLPRISNEVFVGTRSLVRTHELMLFLERMDETLKSVFEKFLRRAKVVILKLDNIVTKKIAQFSEERAKEKLTFIVEEKPAEKEVTPPYEFVKTVEVEEVNTEPEKPVKRSRKKVAL